MQTTKHRLQWVERPGREIGGAMLAINGGVKLWYINTWLPYLSSEDGIESALKYHTLIDTCKNVGLNVKEYFTYVFSRLIEGEKDYEKLLHSAVAR